MSARTLQEVFSDYARSWTGDLDRDMAERALPPEQAHDVMLHALAWQIAGPDAGPEEVEALKGRLLLEDTVLQLPADAALALIGVGMMVGVEWNREARRGG